MVAELGGSPNWSAPTPIAWYNLAAMPARYALERGAWAEAAALGTHARRALRGRDHPFRARDGRRARRPAGRGGAGCRGAEGAAARACRAATPTGTSRWDPAPRRRGLGRLRTRASATRRSRRCARRRSAKRRRRSTPSPPARSSRARAAGEMLLLTDRPAEALREFEAVRRDRAAPLPRRLRRRALGRTRRRPRRGAAALPEPAGDHHARRAGPRGAGDKRGSSSDSGEQEW